MSTAAAQHGAGRFRYGAVLLLTLAVAIFALVTPDGGRRAHDRAPRRRSDARRRGADLAGAAATRRAAGLVVTVAVLGAGLAGAIGSPHPALTFAATAFLLATAGGVILAGLVRLIVDRGVVLQAVLGALAVYMLVGLTLGFIIGALATGVSGPYFASGTDATQSARVYFSFTTLTTTGFGDYTAATRGGRALAVLEMLVGQLYLVTVITLLVGNLRRHRP